MNKFQNLIFFNCLFSYIFSITVTNIEPSIVTFGGEVAFALTVQDYDSSDNDFYLENEYDDSYFKLYCSPLINSYNILNCSANIKIHHKEKLNYPIKTLYVNKIKTNLTVTIEKPKTLKLLNFNDYGHFYSYGISLLKFEVNYNELYNSDVSIKFDDYSISNCTLDEESILYIKCYYEFPENSAEKSLNLKFDKKITSYKIKIEAPNEFSYIYHLYKEIYYSSESIQEVYFVVNSSYKMNDHSFVLVPVTSGNENITLSNCTYFKYGIEYGKCSGILNKYDKYYILNDNKNISKILYVYPEQTAITKIKYIKPEKLLISSSSTTFTLTVDYIINLDKAIFTLVDRFNSNNKIDLKKCSKVDKSYDQITCVGKITNAGDYYAYLNGVNQDEYVSAHSLSLSKALFIYNNLIKFEPEEKRRIEIIFDSDRDYSSKVITLKGNNEKKFANLELIQVYYCTIEYWATFPVNDIYYVYIDNVKQDVYVTVTNEPFTSKVTSITPTLVNSVQHNDIIYELTVDTNLGIKQVDFSFKKFDDNHPYSYLSCNPDSSDKKKATCKGYIDGEGIHYIIINNEIEFKNVTVNVKNLPSIYYFSPISVFSSNNKQNIILYFQVDISKYINKVTFVGNENIKAKCETFSKYYLNCSAVFKKVDKYYITFDGVNMGEYINVIENMNVINYLKLSSILLSLILLL